MDLVGSIPMVESNLSFEKTIHTHLAANLMYFINCNVSRLICLEAAILRNSDIVRKGSSGRRGWQDLV